MAYLRLRTLTLSAVVAAGALTLSACGAGTADADLANGKKLFTQGCGGCHTMVDAGTKGIIGPNLDDAFRGARYEGYPASHFQGVVRYWIENPDTRALPAMPANIVTGKDADDVAAYVAVSAGVTKDGELIPSPARPAEEIE